MKKILLLLFTLALCLPQCYAQTLSYSQLHKLLNTWMQGKGKNVRVINMELRALSPKWKISSFIPTSDDQYTKYYVWTSIDGQKDTSAVALYIEEDESTTKYSLRYAFHSLTNYQSLSQSLKSDHYYSRINTQTDDSKGELELLALADNSLPMNKRIDFMLSDYDLHSSSEHPRLFTVDINSRYIPKSTSNQKL